MDNLHIIINIRQRALVILRSKKSVSWYFLKYIEHHSNIYNFPCIKSNSEDTTFYNPKFKIHPTLKN